jgi:hypothetical protein
MRGKLPVILLFYHDVNQVSSPVFPDPFYSICAPLKSPAI